MGLDSLRWAKFFAHIKHTYFSKTGKPQTYAGLAYTHHLAAVEAVLRRFGPATGLGSDWGMVWNMDYAEEFMLTASWLHDSIEDTDTKRKEIAEYFGDVVADLVWAVTNEPGENRKIRAALTYPKIRDGGRLAVRLKLADRIANVEQGGDLVKMYRKEHEDFRRALFTPGENEDMWVHLDGLLKKKE